MIFHKMKIRCIFNIVSLGQKKDVMVIKTSPKSQCNYF